MKSIDAKTNAALRVSRPKRRMRATRTRRVEVSVPSRDAPLVRVIASALCSGGDKAEMIRNTLQPMLITGRAKTGAELVALLRASPIVELGLEIERDRSTGHSVEFG